MLNVVPLSDYNQFITTSNNFSFLEKVWKVAQARLRTIDSMTTEVQLPLRNFDVLYHALTTNTKW
jgi:hypothetical protein